MKKRTTYMMLLIFISMQGIAQSIKADECDTIFITWEKVAEPIGGIEALDSWLDENNQFKNITSRNKKKNRVILQFNVDTTGLLIDIKVVIGIGNPYDHEAYRLLEECPIIWEPSICRGQKRITLLTYPVSFQKQKKKKKYVP